MSAPVSASRSDASPRYMTDDTIGLVVATKRNPALLANPAWATRLIGKNYEALEDEVPPQWLPKLDHVKPVAKGISARATEYGCGVYGCAFPTLDADVVMKLTTDSTEFEFARDISETLVVPCVVKYHAAMELDQKHDGRRVFLLWREEAKDIGKLGGRAFDLVNAQHERAQVAFEYVVDGETGQLLRDALDAWIKSVEAMGKSSELRYLADGLVTNYKRLGVFIGDIHTGNIGKVTRGKRLQWVVSDPGHSVVIRSSK